MKSEADQPDDELENDGRVTHGREWVEQHARYRRSLNASTLRRELGRQKGECTWCGGPVGRGRQTWCSDRCVKEFRRQCDPQYVSDQIKRWIKRGRWRELRCESCGHDLNARQEVLRWMERRLRWLSIPVGRNPYRHRLSKKQERRRVILESMLYRAQYDRRFAKLDRWELDHVAPVCEGGGCCGPEGLRVLCVACHRGETKKLAGRRARARVRALGCRCSAHPFS